MNNRQTLELFLHLINHVNLRFEMLRKVEDITHKRFEMTEAVLRTLAESGDERVRRLVDDSAAAGKEASNELKRWRDRFDTLDDALITKLKLAIEELPDGE